MALDYLDFEYSEDEHGIGTFDAMASVFPANLPALYADIAQVLDWAHREWGGSYGPLDEDGDWDFDWQALQEPDTLLQLHLDWDEPTQHWQVHATGTATTAPAHTRTTVTLSITGRAQFCDALRERFLLDAN